jgi:16S rRNA processing protein RimM
VAAVSGSTSSTSTRSADTVLVTPESDPGDLVVGRLGRAHGIRGDIAVEVRTDAPELRFAPGSILRTDPPAVGPLTVTASKEHSSRLLLHFLGIDDRTAAEALSGTLLVITRDEAGAAGDDAWWDHELIGLTVENADGTVLGEVADVIHAAAQDLLAVRLPAGREALLPFVRALVPEVDLAHRRLVAVPPDGWSDL